MKTRFMTGNANDDALPDRVGVMLEAEIWYRLEKRRRAAGTGA